MVDILLSPEHESARRQAVRREYSTLRHLLGLPEPEQLQGQEAIVVQNIARHIATIRGALGQANNIQQSLEAERAQQYQRLAPPAGLTAAEQAGHETIQRADAILQAVYRVLDERDMRGLIDQIPAAIRPVDGSNRWVVPALLLRGCNRRVEIDFTNSFWRTGQTLETIRRAIVERRPDQVGVLIDPPLSVPPPAVPTPLPGPPELDEADVTAILGSSADVIDIDPRLLLQEVELENIPAAGNRVIVDVPRLLRVRNTPPGGPPYISQLTAAELTTYFVGPGTTEYVQLVRCVDNDGNPLPLPPATQVVDPLFNRLGRLPAQALVARTTPLRQALTDRRPIDQIIAGPATNREKLLALVTLQRDPSAAEATSGEIVRIRREIAENDVLLRAADALRQLGSAQLPEFNETDANEGIAAMTDVIAAAQAAAAPTAPPATARVNDIVAALSTGPPNLQNLARRVGITRHQILRRELVTNPATGVVTQQDNWAEFQAVIDAAIQGRQRFEESGRRIAAIQRVLDGMGVALQAREIQPAQLPPADYTSLHQHLNILGGGSYPAIPASIVLTMNVSALEQEFRRALLQANPERSLVLQDVSTYETRRNELSTQLAEAMRTAGTRGPQGSEACWAVVRRGLENQGIRGEELERATEYMKTRIQVTPETAGEARSFAREALGTPVPQERLTRRGGFLRRRPRLDEETEQFNREETKEWEKERHSRIRDYERRLFTTANVGLPLDQDPWLVRDLTTLTHAYFRTKYLLEKIGDDKRLPRLSQYEDFLFRFHECILERAQESSTQALVAGGVGAGQMNQLRALGLNIDASRLPSMSATERRQAVNEYLSGDAYYTDERKRQIEAMADRAYRPIRQHKETYEAGVQKRQEGKERRRGWVRGEGAFYNPVAVTVRRLKNVFKGEGEEWNPLTWPARTVKGTWKHRWAVGGATGPTYLGAIAGAGPFGAIVGAFLIAKSIRDKSRAATAGGG